MVPWLGPSTEVAAPWYWPPSPAQHLQILLCFKVLLWAPAATPLLCPSSPCSPAWPLHGFTVLTAMTERQAVQPGVQVCGWRGAIGVSGLPVSAPTTAPPLPAAGGAVQWLLQCHALELHHEVGDGRQQARGWGWGGARGHLVAIVSPVSGRGAHPIFADDAGRQQSVIAAAQKVLLGRCLNQVGPAVMQCDGKDVELAASHCSLQAVLGCSRGGDAGERCVLSVLHLLEADVITLIQEGTNRDGVAELFGLGCNQGWIITVYLLCNSSLQQNI